MPSFLAASYNRPSACIGMHYLLISHSCHTSYRGLDASYDVSRHPRSTLDMTITIKDDTMVVGANTNKHSSYGK